MVLDLVNRWYAHGVGKQHKFDKVQQAIFYANNSVVLMEHVVIAVAMTATATSIIAEANEVKRVLKSKVKLDDMGNPLLSADGNYFVMDINRKKFYDDVADQTMALGPGLAKSVLRTIHQDTTAGIPNIKYEQNEKGVDSVLINATLILSVASAVEAEIFNTIRKEIKNKKPVLSWDEQYYIFDAGFRETMLRPHEHSRKVPRLAAYHHTEYVTALGYLARRRCGGLSVWRTPPSEAAAKEVPEATMNSEEFRTWPDREKVRIVMQTPLLIHRDLIDNISDTISKSDVVHRRFYEKCMRIAGRKVGDVVITGFSDSEDGDATSFITITNAPVQIAVKNPLFVRDGGFRTLLGPNCRVEIDPVFDRRKRQIIFTHESDIDGVLLAHHKLVVLDHNRIYGDIVDGATNTQPADYRDNFL
jgi:hypothetical protein